MAVDAHLKKLKFRPDVRLELGSNEAIKQAVIGGLGIAVLSKYSLGDKSDQEEVAILKCKEFRVPRGRLLAWFCIQLEHYPFQRNRLSARCIETMGERKATTKPGSGLLKSIRRLLYSGITARLHWV